MRISIDPGLEAGYCVWTSDWQLVEAGVIKPSRKNYSWEERGNMVVEKISEIKSRFNIREACIEMPSYFASAGGAMVAARGDLVKLTWLVGLIYGLFPFGKCKLVKVNEWKGNLPKNVVIQRLKKLMAPEDFKRLSSHSYDAAGIGLYMKGDFK